MTNTSIYKLLTISGIVLNTVPRLVYEFKTPSTYLYYTCDALSILLFIISARFYINSRWNSALYWIAVWLACSNFMDELVFNPIQLGWNELAFLLFITIWTIARTKKTHGKFTSGA